MGRRRLPDLSFVSNENLRKLKKSHFEGAPDLIVEFVSSESQERDWDEKYLQCESCGVKEYWVIDADRRKAEIFVREGRALRLAHHLQMAEACQGSALSALCV